MSQNKVKIKLKETKQYKEYYTALEKLRVDENKVALQVKSLLNDTELLLLDSGDLEVDVDKLLPKEVRDDLNQQREFVDKLQEEYASMLRDIYTNWLEEISTSDISVPGVKSFKAFKEAEKKMQEHEQNKYYEKETDLNKRLDLEIKYTNEYKELLTEMRKRRDILNIVFDTHIVEY